MSRTIKTVSLAVVALVLIYFGYDLLKDWLYPCEGIFREAAVTLETKLDVIKGKGEFAIGRQKTQDLTGTSREVALNLKTCCIVLGKASGDFLRCKEGFDRYDAEINRLATSVKEAEAAKERGNSEVAVQKIAEANQSVEVAEASAEKIAKQVAEIKGKGKGKEGPSDTGGAQAGGQAAPVTTGYSSVVIYGVPGKGRLQIKVNGLLAGQYDRNVDQELSPVLTAGANNTITFTFSQPGGSVDVLVCGKPCDWVTILKFVAKPEKLEESVQIPYVGGKK